MPSTQNDVFEFNKEICELKHKEIDQSLRDIKTQLQDCTEHMERGIIAAIKQVEDKLDSKMSTKEENLKNKIVVTEKSVNEKIDVLADFHAVLRGNGQPSIFELVRTLKFRQNIVLFLLVIIFFCMIAGDYRGISISKIRKFIGLESKQVDSTPPNVSIPDPQSSASLSPRP
jgi:DNA-binding transcriptional MerR regulator